MILNNFYYDQTLLKNQVKKRRFSQTITEKWQNDGCMTSYVKIGTWYRKEIFPNVSLIMLHNFYRDQHCLKIKLRWRNRRLSEKLLKTEKSRLYDVIRQNRDMIWKRKSLSTLLKNQVKVTKKEIKSKNYWKTAKWRH